jgi:hypothetical protein
MAEHPCSQRRETAIEYHGDVDRLAAYPPDGTDVQLEEILKGLGFSSELSEQVNASFSTHAIDGFHSGSERRQCRASRI